MDQTERQVIDGLFDRLRQAEQGSGARDAGAEAHINQLVSAYPAAPYYMAQAILVQEHALKAAQERIEAMEQEDSQPAASGGFLGGLFGAGSNANSGRGSVPRAGMRYPRQNEQAAADPVARYQQSGRGGGFLSGAMHTAMGVAGGVLAANMISNMFGGGDAQASQTAGEAGNQPQQQDETQQAEANNDDEGGFFGHDGDFDI